MSGSGSYQSPALRGQAQRPDRTTEEGLGDSRVEDGTGCSSYSREGPGQGVEDPHKGRETESRKGGEGPDSLEVPWRIEKAAARTRRGVEALATPVFILNLIFGSPPCFAGNCCQEMEFLDITSIRDTRFGKFAKTPKVSGPRTCYQ